jgi:hypothetical protein
MWEEGKEERGRARGRKGGDCVMGGWRYVWDERRLMVR